MADKQFDPEKFIDRDFEQELFEDLLQFKDQARILAIEDEGGMGKSQLLQKFQYRCRTASRPRRIPVSLIDLKHLSDHSPLALVQQIAKDLSAFPLDFPTFTAREIDRRLRDFSQIRGAVDLRDADMRQAQIHAAGVMNNITQAESVTVNMVTPTPTDELLSHVRDLCVQAFLTDLAHVCQEQSVVILLDAYEYCYPDLQRWLLDHFLESHCFNLAKRPARLLFVVAGRKLPPFKHYWSPTECEEIVKSVNALGKWKPAHVEECLRVHGFRYNERELKFFCDMIEMDYAPSYVVEAMEFRFANRGRG